MRRKSLVDQGLEFVKTPWSDLRIKLQIVARAPKIN